MNKKIGVLDSGIGGTTVLDKVVELLPNEEYVYYADTINNPYGEKSEEELYKIVKEIVTFLINKKNCKMIVLACNTATTKCMERLKEEFPEMLFVGTVPAVKAACDKHYKHTLVLATPATIESERMAELVHDNKAANQEIILCPCLGLAHAIEENNEEKITQILEKIQLEMKDKKIDSIVLGCTHYPLIKERIASFFPDAELLDGSLGVAQEVKRQLESHNLLSQTSTGNIEYIDSEGI